MAKIDCAKKDINHEKLSCVNFAIDSTVVYVIKPYFVMLWISLY